MSRILIHGTGRSGTTITQRIVNYHPDLWVTNEFLLYDAAFGYYLRNIRSIHTPQDYFKSLLVKDDWNSSVEHDWHIPDTLDRSTFVSQCLDNLTTDTVKGRVEAAEKTLYNGFVYYGDKLLESEVLEKMIDNDMDFKVIHIVRDMRDVVASKMHHRFEINKSDSYDMDCTIDYEIWRKVRGRMDPSNYVELKFEDYANGTVNIDKISSLLSGVDTSKFYEGFSKLFDIGRLKKGFYKQVIPDWADIFNKRSVKLLEELNYI